MAHPSRRTALTTAFAAALATSLVACSGSNNAESTSAATEQENSQTATEANGSAENGSDSAATVPDGYTAVKLPDINMSFAVPSGWETLTPTDAADAERMSAFTQATGLDADSVQLKLETYSMICAAIAQSGATEEIDVRVDATVNELRTEEEISADAKENDIGSVDLSVSTTTTGTGAEARTISYSIDLLGTMQYAAIINTLNPDGDGIVLFSITSTASAERAQELADAILSSI
ncbi:MAG: hypothetical protein E7Z94_11600 [Actinomyces ruminicola]|uniref:Lipoprotein LpqN n=1 Tax=Actinomyces ruminicola TaxID=332524 RepID=A0A1G9S2M8_9ACTO|nr:hypothetical protein [Actinomyces ruminicola]MBE6482993.1 hypothetical protein [Actinomyces ruminicola]SDM29721.1 hypothetical protein SAMN04487766_101260 [Actinomyces ruminicola]